MVALNTAYAAPKNAADPKNSVRDFFYEDRASVGKNRGKSRLNTQEKERFIALARTGRFKQTELNADFEISRKKVINIFALSTKIPRPT
jgi:hypothetical protein